MKKPGNAGGAKARQEGGCVESMTQQEELSKVEETPNPDYAGDLNPSEIWAQKKGRSSLI